MSNVNPEKIMKPRKAACPIKTVTGFLGQAANPSLWALMATLKGKKSKEGP